MFTGLLNRRLNGEIVLVKIMPWRIRFGSTIALIKPLNQIGQDILSPFTEISGDIA